MSKHGERLNTILRCILGIVLGTILVGVVLFTKNPLYDSVQDCNSCAGLILRNVKWDILMRYYDMTDKHEESVQYE